MNQRYILAAALAVSLIPLYAQQPNGDQIPLYQGTSIHVDGVYITPVSGAPFSGTVEIQNASTLPNGSVEIKRTINLIGRDSRGKIHNERRQLVTDAFKGTPRLTEVHLFDPASHLSTYYDTATRIARQQTLPEPTNRPTNPRIKLEDLGTSTVEGLYAKGTRRSFTIPALASGTGAAVEVVDEYWYSEDLQINLLMTRKDPRTGTQTVKLTNILRDEPAAEFFEVPEGYKIVDVTPPAGAPASGKTR